MEDVRPGAAGLLTGVEHSRVRGTPPDRESAAGGGRGGRRRRRQGWAAEVEDVRSGAAGLLTGMEHSRVRNNAWMYLISIVTTRTAVGLVDVHGNYLTSLEYDSNSTRLGLFM